MCNLNSGFQNQIHEFFFFFPKKLMGEKIEPLNFKIIICVFIMLELTIIHELNTHLSLLYFRSFGQRMSNSKQKMTIISYEEK